MCEFPPCMWIDQDTINYDNALYINIIADNLNTITFIDLLSLKDIQQTVQNAFLTNFNVSLDPLIETLFVTNDPTTSPTTAKPSKHPSIVTKNPTVLSTTVVTKPPTREAERVPTNDISTDEPIDRTSDNGTIITKTVATPTIGFFWVFVFYGCGILIYAIVYCDRTTVPARHDYATDRDNTGNECKHLFYANVVWLESTALAKVEYVQNFVDIGTDIFGVISIMLMAPNTNDPALYRFLGWVSLFATVAGFLCFVVTYQYSVFFYTTIARQRKYKIELEKQCLIDLKKNEGGTNYNRSKHVEMWEEYLGFHQKITLCRSHIAMMSLFGVALENAPQCAVFWYLNFSAILNSNGQWLGWVIWIWLKIIFSLYFMIYSICLIFLVRCHGVQDEKQDLGPLHYSAKQQQQKKTNALIKTLNANVTILGTIQRTNPDEYRLVPIQRTNPDNDDDGQNIITQSNDDEVAVDTPLIMRGPTKTNPTTLTTAAIQMASRNSVATQDNDDRKEEEEQSTHDDDDDEKTLLLKHTAGKPPIVSTHDGSGSVQHNTNQHQGGTLYYQSAHFTSQQCTNIAKHFDANKSGAPFILFGDNNEDKTRDKSHSNRQYSGGQAESVGAYDHWFAYGITTTWKHKGGTGVQGNAPPPDFGRFKGLMNEQFSDVIRHLQNGYDVIIPTPMDEDMRDNPNKYFDENDVLKVKHNLGTGIANLDLMYLTYIQSKLDELEQYASEIKKISHCKMYQDDVDSNGDDKKQNKEVDARLEVDSNRSDSICSMSGSSNKEEELTQPRSLRDIHEEEELKSSSPPTNDNVQLTDTVDKDGDDNDEEDNDEQASLVQFIDGIDVQLIHDESDHGSKEETKHQHGDDIESKDSHNTEDSFDETLRDQVNNDLNTALRPIEPQIYAQYTNEVKRRMLDNLEQNPSEQRLLMQIAIDKAKRETWKNDKFKSKLIQPLQHKLQNADDVPIEELFRDIEAYTAEYRNVNDNIDANDEEELKTQPKQKWNTKPKKWLEKMLKK
eukprot:405248_1